MVVESVAYGSEPAQKIVTVAFEYDNAGIALVESLMDFEIGDGQTVVASFVRYRAAHGAFFQHAGGHVDLDGDFVAFGARPTEDIEESHR